MIYKELYPLTLPQRSFYYDYLLNQNGCKYNMGAAMIINGDLDIDLFKKAFDSAIKIYDSLRIRFIQHDGELLQTFIPEYQCEIEYLDFRNHINPLEDALKYIEKERLKPLAFVDVNLSKDSILQTGDKQFIWFPFFHHFSDDGYGKSVVHRTVTEIYNSLLTSDILPDLHPFSYRDFIADDLDYQSSDSFKTSSEFWKSKMTPLAEPLDFTSKKYTIKKFSPHNERITLNLHRMCYASILKVADQTEVTTLHALLGVLFTTLYKLFNKKDIVVGMPVLNRSNHKFRNTPGLFMNMIPFRLQLDENWTLTEILKAIKSEVKECYRHQRLPMSETFSHFRNNPEFKNELFDVTIIYRKMDFNYKLDNSKIRTITLDSQIRNESFGMEIDEYDDEENVNIFFNYNPLIFSELEIIQFARCFETILFELIYFPEKSIREVKFLNDFEHHKLIKTFNTVDTVKHTKKTIVSKFEDCVRNYANNIAVTRNEESITYFELNKKANETANYLREKCGVLKGDIVCMAVDRTISSITTMMGIMKAGAVYLPVDSHYPIERIDFIVKDSGAKIFITDNSVLTKLIDNVVLLSTIESSNTENSGLEISREDLAYIIYTSGSTGVPKGVMIEHGNFMHMFINMIGIFGVTSTDRVLQFASLGFDAAVFEILEALLMGSSLVIADNETIRNPASFIQYMDTKRVSIATLPPAYLSILDKPELPFLHTLITAGEHANVSDVNHYKKTKKVINGYGPTETSVCASYYVTGKDTDYSGSVPIGKPVPGSSAYIVNENLEQMPIGFSGELCISGPNVARGYLNNKELTEKKFIQNPFEHNLRMYRTGDKARLLFDGTLEFLGRMDEQVKIKGNRIELGEIENRLRNYTSVREAVVLDVEINDFKDLAAFIICDEEINPKTLRKYLIKFLPDYMVPSYICFIDKIPLTQNGKINKTELRKLVPVYHDTVKPDPAETTLMEQMLTPITERVLNRAPIGVDENFFELGIDSLKIARLITYIKKELQLEIVFKTIFEKPTIRGVAAELALENTNTFEDIIPVPHKEFYPLSHAQKRLWILAQDKANTAVYNMPVVLLLKGNLQTHDLKHAIQTIVARHEALRTIFVEIEGTPFQKILSSYDNFINESDFSQENNSEEKAEALINKEVMSPFDLSREIPIRFHLIKISQERHVILLMIHHIAGDGVSIGIIMNELAKLYDSSDNLNRGNILNRLRIQYKDYCAYEQEILQSVNYRTEKEFWLTRLQNPLPVLHLPTDKVRPAIKTYHGSYVFAKIENQLKKGLLKFCKENNASPFMVILASVNILLNKYTSQEDIILGTPVSGRNHQNLEDQVGVYINTIALRNTVDSNIEFIEFLDEVKRNSSEAFSNSNYPFDSLIQNLELERDTSRSPVFDVLIQYQNQDVTTLSLNNIRTSFYGINFNAAKFDLTLTFTEKEENIEFNIGYNTDLFFQPRIERIVRHLLNILSDVLANPDRLIRDINVLDQDEKRALHGMSHGIALQLNQRTVVEQFEFQAQRVPDNIALVFNEIRLSYRELDEQSNRIATEILANISVAPDEIIAIMVPRSELFVVGILGILKTGAAYLPISTELPLERVKFMLRDSSCKVLLTDSGLQAMMSDILDSENEVNIMVLDIRKIDDQQTSKPISRNLAPSNLAYVIYTSGSTGTPKGVMIEHGSLYNLVMGLSKEIYQDETNFLNIALISPFVFDASVKQLFYALLFGHCLDIVPDEIKMNGRKLLEYYESHCINVSDGTPVHLEIILDELSLGTGKYIPGLFVIGGQQLPVHTVRQLLQATDPNFPSIVNVYGPTECCDVSTCYAIDPEFILSSETAINGIPIGKPLPNIQVFILDSNLNQVPVGVFGELCIGGSGLARGYINRPDLTDEKFITVNLDNCNKIYKTGDIGCYLDDGRILLSGRTDEQIKLRGYRIELNEIENCIRNYNHINLVAVKVMGEGNFQKIAAFYSSTGKIDQEELKQYLSLHLPDYMIPAYLIEIDVFPVTQNGKIDKKLLSIPEGEVSAVKAILLLKDPLEEKLTNLWKEFLQLQYVSLTDNFFNLGGHSLIAIRLASRIHKEFSIEVSIWEIFKYPTISLLAQLLRSKNPSRFNPIEKMEEREYYPLSHSQRRLWMLAKLEGQNSIYNIPAALLMKGKLNLKAFEAAFQSVVLRHESLRTSFIEIDGEPFQKISDNLPFTIEKLSFPELKWDESVLKGLANEYFEKEFDLTQAPLMEIKLISLSGDSHLFLFNMHHIISDGWSLDIILNEFKFYYNAYLTQSDASLSPLRIQYKDYASWQNKILGDQSMVVVKDYWHRKLSKPHPQLNLPADFKRTESFSLDGELLSYSLDSTAVKSLTEIGNNQNASIFMTLLSAVYILLYRYTGEEDIMVGSPVAGRQHYDIENQVGFFINTLVLRTEINPENSFLEVLKKVNSTLAEALDNQAYPFDRLVDELDIERILNRNPLFDVMVAWMIKDGMNMKMNFDGIEAKGLDFRITKSMFDLSFLFAENEGKISWAIEYNSSLFREESIQRMSDHFNVLINSIISNPKEKIKNLEIIPVPEKEKLLSVSFETSRKVDISNNTILQFRNQVRKNKCAVAIVNEGKSISYEELERLSNRIANEIIERSAPAKDDIIAVIIDDAILAVASILGTMKTGAAYLPILSDNPEERISFILKDSKSKAVLVDSKVAKELSVLRSETSDNLAIIDISLNLSENTAVPEINIEPDSLAYVIYTSGSTGIPKGVMIEHESLTQLIFSLNERTYSHYGNGLHELMIGSFAFDVSLKQLFATLCHGNSLHIIGKERRFDPREIIKYIIDKKVNIVDLTPSLFSVMLDEGFGKTEKPDLREIFLGSEALPFKLVKNFYDYGHNECIKTTNFYGPTECCVESSFFEFLPATMQEEYDIAPIGKPVLNEQLFILDSNLNLCPKGIPGEICIAGKGLARQYLNDPKKTAEKFVQFTALNNIRIYRTGDLGKMLPDGNIEFLGRIDDQVKIRGYRVELQEIENQLREITEIRECAVILFEGNGTADLAGYYTANETIDKAKIKTQLERFLPTYMIPVYLIQLEKIPLSSNGKVDKKLLPNPSGLNEKVKSREPKDEIESIILGIYSDVLKKDSIYLEDNFFEIGGNSLNAVRVISRIQKEFNVDIALKEIFYSPVLLDISDKVKKIIPDKDILIEDVAENIIVPISDYELELLSNLQFDDEE